MPNPVVKIEIVMNDDASINIGSSHIDNELLMYGLLEVAKRLVTDHNKNKDKKIVAPPPGFAIPRA